jgi:hypothetical protein
MRRRGRIRESEDTASLDRPIRVPGLVIQNPASGFREALSFGKIPFALAQPVFQTLLLSDVAA